MWNKPWNMKEGFLIGGCFILAGLLLQLIVGPVAWEVFAWPTNGITMAVFLTIIVSVFLLRKRVYAFRFFSTIQAAIPTLVYAVVLTIIMGLTRQKSLTPGPSPMGEGSLWINYMLSFWPFVLIYVLMAFILGLVVLRQLRSWVAARFSPSSLPFSLLSHLGLFLAMTTATLGNADMQRLKMITVVGEPEWRALDAQQQIVRMPLAIELKQFIMETYSDGSPKRYASEILIQTKSGQSIEATVDVNKPVEVEGWKIYQYGYDTKMGALSQTSILELVSDPWLPLVYTGIYMMLAGAVFMFILGGRKRV